jgi:hypothetical protein
MEHMNASPKPTITRCKEIEISLKYRPFALDSEISAEITCFGLAKKVLIDGINVIRVHNRIPPKIDTTIKV